MQRLTIITATFILATALTGCAGNSEDSSVSSMAIEEALEMENGGYDIADSEPYFGQRADFEELGLDVEDPEVTDPFMVHGPEGMPAEGVEVEGVNVLVLWGQPRPNPELETPHRWDGELAVTDGALALRRLVRFEGPTDELLPRMDRQSVAFRSTTLPHHDGLLVTLLPPRPASDDATPPETAPALVLQLEDIDPIIVDVTELEAGYRLVVPVDDLGNTVVIATAPAHPCPHGILAGVWEHIRRDLGTFRGRWMGAEGELHGHVDGIWGVNRAGRRVLFGKYIGNDGQFRGLLRGVWGEGRFTAVFVDADGQYIGGLGGHYGELDAPLPGDGLFGGRWIEACEAERCGPEGECPGVEPEVPGADELI